MKKSISLLLFVFIIPVASFAQLKQTPSELLQSVKRHGEIRVIAKLKQGARLKNILTKIDSEEEYQQAKDAISSVVNHIKNSPEIKPLIGRSISLIRAYHVIPYFSATVDKIGVEALLRNDSIQSVAESQRLTVHLSKSVPLVTSKTNPWKYFKDKKGNLLGGKDTIVAVLDTGIDRDHPMVKGKVKREACFVTDNSCPYRRNRGYGAGTAKDKSPWKYRGHGMHVSGIAAGKYIERKDVVFGGVAHEAKIVFARVFDKDGRAYADSVVSALEWVYSLKIGGQKLNITSVNISIGDELAFNSYCDYKYQGSYKDIITKLKSKGVAVIASSGNESFLDGMGFPACLSNVISVGNSTKNDLFYADSNSARILDLVAPGTKIYSAYTHPIYPKYYSLTGTSMSAPHVAGAWAVMKQLYPNATVDSVKAALQSTGKIIKDGRSGQTWFYAPRLNLGEAIDNYGTNINHKVNAAFGNGWDKRFEKGGFPWIHKSSDGSTKGVLKNHGQHGQWNKLALRKNFRDGTVKAKIKRVSNSFTGDNKYNSNNIFIRCSGPLFTSSTDYPQPEICMNGYFFNFTNNGSVSVWKINNGLESPLLPWNSSFAHLIRDGGYNRLWVRATGNKLEFGINGTMIWVGYDSDHKEGQNGVSYYRNEDTSAWNTVYVDYYYQHSDASLTMGQNEEPDMTQYILQDQYEQLSEDALSGSSTGVYH